MACVLFGAVEAVAPQEAPCLADYDTRQEEQREEVGDGHQCVEDVCHVPYDIETDDGTEIYGDEEDDAGCVGRLLRQLGCPFCAVGFRCFSCVQTF